MPTQELEVVEVSIDDLVATTSGEDVEALAGPLLRLEPLASYKPLESVAPVLSATMFPALKAVAEASPAAAALFRKSAELGVGLSVVFPPTVMKGLSNGSLKLMETATGDAAIAVSSTTGQIVKHGRVVSDSAAAVGGGAGAVAGGVAGAAASGTTLVAMAPILIPVAIAAAAAVAQQARLERALASIQAAVDRIEARLEDTDHGICDAAEAFLVTTGHAVQYGPLPPYLRLELAAQRARIEALYAPRRRWVRRFKEQLEREQIEYEKKHGESQPWADEVERLAREGKLEEELVLFVRALLSQTKFDALAAICLAEEGSSEVAMRMLDSSAKELRSEFFDLHNRLKPLAIHEPVKSFRDKVPLMGNRTEHAHSVIKALVEQLDQHVLPNIPNPWVDTPLEVSLSPDQVVALSRP